MPDTSLDAAGYVAERLRAQIAGKPFKISHEQGLLDVTVSIGVAVLDARVCTSEMMLEAADEALYRSKREGRNRVTLSNAAVAAA